MPLSNFFFRIIVSDFQKTVNTSNKKFQHLQDYPVDVGICAILFVLLEHPSALICGVGLLILHILTQRNIVFHDLLILRTQLRKYLLILQFRLLQFGQKLLKLRVMT